MGIIGRAIGAAIVGATVVTAAYVTLTTLGASEGVNDRLRKVERVIGQYTGKPVTIDIHNKDFRLKNYTVRNEDPTKITLYTEFRGNPYEQATASRPVKFNISGTPEQIAAMRENFYGLLNRTDANVWCTIEAPGPNTGIFEKEYNGEHQWTTDDPRWIKCGTRGKKEINVGNRHDVLPIDK